MILSLLFKVLHAAEEGYTGFGGEEGYSGGGDFGDSAGGILQNYLKSGIDSIPQLISYILKLAAMIGLPIVVLFIMWAGFMYVTARGDQAKISRAHDAFLYSVIGAALVLGAAVIAAAIQGTISNLSV